MGTRTLLAGVLVVLATSGCGGEELGACLVEEDFHTRSWCYNDTSEDTCNTSHTSATQFIPEKTCDDIGHTKQCPGEPDRYWLQEHDC